MNRDVLLKTNIIGGFDKEDVINYINTLQQSCNNSKIKSEVDDMRLRVATLREILKEKDKKIDALTKEVENLKSISSPEENSTKKFNALKCSNETIKKAENDVEAITAQISADIKNKEDKVSALLEKLSAVNEEINSFNDSFSVLSDKISDVAIEPSNIISKPATGFDFDKVMEAISVAKANEEKPKNLR